MPLCIDLFCGLGGWTEGFLAEGWDVIGFDNHRHEYGESRYPAQLVIQDVLTLHGSQFRSADCIVASPPCQRYSWMAMPWSLAKREASWQRWHRDSPFSTGFDLNDLFNACFRIQREASEAAGRKIPMVVENVKGAQPWVGQAKAHFGSYYLWGDVESIGGRIVSSRPKFGEFTRAAKTAKVPGLADGTFPPGGLAQGFINNGVKTNGIADIRDGHTHTRHLTNQRESDALKVPGINWSGHGRPGYEPQGFNVTAAARYREEQGRKQEGSGAAWFDNGIRKSSSRSDSRKAASAQIAKIPLPLSQFIARIMKP